MEAFLSGLESEYISAIIGGVMIGIAAVFLMAMLGRIAGVSGILGTILDPTPVAGNDSRLWRVAFIVGLVCAPILFAYPSGIDIPYEPVRSLPLLIIGGLIVGIGTQVGGGCTSGHGICGISRFSGRSVVATIVFMASAMVTVGIRLHVVGS